MDSDELKTRLTQCIDQSVLEKDRSTLFESIKFAALELKKWKIVDFFRFGNSGDVVKTSLRNYGKDRNVLSVVYSPETSLDEIAGACKLELGLGGGL